MVRLRKDYDTRRNSKYAEQLREDMQSIENHLNQNEDDLKRHKTSDIAHTSNQIKHGLYSVANRIDNIWSRIINLVLNHDGKDVKEVVDIRVARDASIHPTAKDRLDYDFQILEQEIEDSAVSLNLKKFIKKYGSFTSGFKAALSLAKLYPVHIVVPPGNYKLTETARIYKNTHLTLQAGAVIRRGFVGSMLVNGDKDDQTKGYEGHGNLLIDGQGMFDSAGDEYKEQCSVLGFAHADGIVIKGIHIRDVCGGHGLDCAGNKNVLIDDVKFSGYADYKGDRWFSAAIQLDLMRSSENFGAFGSYDNTPSENIIVQRCHFSKSDKLGGYARAMDSHTSTDGFWYKNIKFLFNVVEDTTEWAVSGNKWEDVLIEGNTFLNCASGVRLLLPAVTSKYTQDKNGNPTNRVNKVRRHIVSKNTFINVKDRHAVQVYGRKGYQTIEDVKINGNFIDGVKVKHAIHLSDVVGFTVSDNEFNNVGHHGVLLTRCKNGQVDLSIGKNIEGNGIRVEFGCENVSINRTRLDEVGYSGISVSGDSKNIDVDGANINNAGKRTSSSNPYYGVIFMDGVEDSSVKFVTVKGKKCRYAMYLTSKCSRIQHFGNRLKGAGAEGSLKDNSVDPIKSFENVT
ncbi:right-handed parallel beta-helix repeat-containing protein [Bacillus sp. FSL K6-1006]|uniref:right-handed parallel beta-helix repeat-containing protein n=1 Tax=Bacillus sp. FSL K6-1006 TaxID=2954677 RepID=UPI0031580C81